MTPSPCWQAPRSPGWTPPPGSSSGTRNRRRTPSRTRSSVPGVICPRSGTRTASTPGSTGCSFAACIDEVAPARRHRVDLRPSRRSTRPTSTGHESSFADRDQLERGFVRLEPEMRAVIVLHHYLDLPLADVAATLGIPVGHREVASAPGPRPAASGARRRRASRARASRKGARHDDATTGSAATSARGFDEEARNSACRITSPRCSCDTMSTRQRPRWSSLGRWLPVRRRRFVAGRSRVGI